MSIQLNKAKVLLKSHQENLSRLGTRHLSIFGSTARNEVSEASDIDILVDKDSLFLLI